MATDERENTFHYSYSAPQHEEVRKIREKYLPREETPMEQLRRLDKYAAQKGMTLALSVGMLGALILGIGMCGCMVWDEELAVLGLVIGAAGFAAMGAAHPMYVNVTKKERARIAPEILRLADQLLN